MPLCDGSASHEVIAKATRRNITKRTNLLKYNDTSCFHLAFPLWSFVVRISWKEQITAQLDSHIPIVVKLYNFTYYWNKHCLALQRTSKTSVGWLPQRKIAMKMRQVYVYILMSTHARIHDAQVFASCWTAFVYQNPSKILAFHKHGADVCLVSELRSFQRAHFVTSWYFPPGVQSHSSNEGSHGVHAGDTYELCRVRIAEHVLEERSNPLDDLAFACARKTLHQQS